MSRYTLGIDTSNYATSLAVFDTAGEVVCAKKRFLPVKEGQLGLRQSDALFHHTTALPEMLEELSRKFDLTQIAAVGVSQKPRPVEGSYMPCFLAGVSAATAFARARGIPLVHTTHQQGHAAAALFAAKGEELFRQKVLLFHISGGTTDLLLCDRSGRSRRWAPAAISTPGRPWTAWASSWAFRSRQVLKSPAWQRCAKSPFGQSPASKG